MIPQHSKVKRALDPESCVHYNVRKGLTREKTHVLSHLLRNLALRLLLVLVLELHRLQLPRVPVAGELIVRDGQRPKVSWVRLSGDKGVRCRLQRVVSIPARYGV